MQTPCFSAIMTWRMDGPREVSAALPVGTVTFVLGDVARSTRLWEDMAAAMPAVLGRLDEVVDDLLERATTSSPCSPRPATPWLSPGPSSPR